jgi:hypothetical protein
VPNSGCDRPPANRQIATGELPTMLVPREQFAITTTLTPEEVRERLSEVVEPVKLVRWRWQRSEKPYQGVVNERSFRISRIIKYRNSFLPIIHGEIHRHYTGSEVIIRMQLQEFVLVFMIFWLVTVGGFALLFALSSIAEAHFESAIFIPVSMFVFGYLLSTLAFLAEARHSKKFLIRLLSP